MHGVDDKYTKIKYLEDFLVLDESQSLSIKLVRGDRLLRFLELIPDDTLTRVMAQIIQDDPAPPLDSEDFRTWVVRKRQLANLTQSELAKEIGVRPEQISRFEGGKCPLKTEHLIKISNRFSNQTVEN
ncbi:helix-turn-helix domain-containing protein [Bdellovibrio sp. HCB337]|uniref:helix-turn-helix domain-containing protein n=1 Tax=Bdellovibrio sp. HCB337 TaxID=3394358 RepID=UPI0039A69A7F